KPSIRAPGDALRADERKRALEFFPVQPELEVPFVQALFGHLLRLLSFGDLPPTTLAHLDLGVVGPFIPDHDRSCAIVASRDNSLEIPIFERVVWRRKREPLD